MHRTLSVKCQLKLTYFTNIKYGSFKGELMLNDVNVMNVMNVLLILVQQSNKLTLLKTDPVLSASLRPLKVLLFATENKKDGSRETKGGWKQRSKYSIFMVVWKTMLSSHIFCSLTLQL